MSLRQEESLSLSSILAPSPLPPTLSRREVKTISAKKSYEKHKIQIRARDVKRKRKQWNEKKQKMKGIYCVKMEGLRRGRGGHDKAQRKKKQHVLATWSA